MSGSDIGISIKDSLPENRGCLAEISRSSVQHPAGKVLSAEYLSQLRDSSSNLFRFYRREAQDQPIRPRCAQGITAQWNNLHIALSSQLGNALGAHVAL